MKNLYLKTILIVSVLFCISCGKEDNNLIKKSGYIIGFDPCTIGASYRIGYIIVTNNLADTLLTYNLSDIKHKIPASILLNPSDTLYKLPASHFENYKSSPFFEDSLRFNYPINFTYSIATENESTFNLCRTDVIFITAPQVIIKSVTIP